MSVTSPPSPLSWKTTGYIGTLKNCTKDSVQTCVFKGHNPVCVFVLSALETQTRLGKKGRLFTRTKHMIVHNYIFS